MTEEVQSAAIGNVGQAHERQVSNEQRPMAVDGVAITTSPRASRRFSLNGGSSANRYSVVQESWRSGASSPSAAHDLMPTEQLDHQQRSAGGSTVPSQSSATGDERKGIRFSRPLSVLNRASPQLRQETTEGDNAIVGSENDSLGSLTNAKASTGASAARRSVVQNNLMPTGSNRCLACQKT